MKVCACGQPARRKYCAQCGPIAARERALAATRRWATRNPEKRAEITRRYYQKNRDEIKRRHAERKLQRPSYEREKTLKKYGMTPNDWDDLFAQQGSRCAICGSDSPNGAQWHTDHCHKTGAVRGILCHGCNTGIGKLRDSAELCEKAAQYLRGSIDPIHALCPELRETRPTSSHVN